VLGRTFDRLGDDEDIAQAPTALQLLPDFPFL
jgi:hypothetical protein